MKTTTPKEEARQCLDEIQYQICTSLGVLESDSTLCASKIISLFCIDKVIEAKPIEPNPDQYESLFRKIESSKIFWQQVKEEIQKIT